MNKRIMLLTALIAASPVVHVVASADAMYNDIKVILEDRATGKTDEGRLDHIQDVLRTVKCYKENMQHQIISLHSRVDHDKPASTVLAGLGSLCFCISTGTLHLLDVDKAAFALLGTISTGAAIFTFYKRNIDLYHFRNKINELNSVIIKLEAMEKPLLEKMSLECVYCNPASDVISPMAKTCTNPMYEKHECNYCHQITQ